MTTPVTVGLPVFNNASTVLTAVRSVFAQTTGDWHLVIVDDGSDDGSVELLKRIDDPRVRLIVDGRNLGLGARLNQIAELASSPWLARMDADDLMHPERLERQLSALVGSTYDLAVSDAISIDEEDRPTGYRRSVTDPSVKRQFRHSPYIHPTVLGNTSWFRAHPYDARYRRCQDQELWVRTSGDRSVVGLEEPLLYLREAGTVSAAKYGRSMAGTRQVLRHHGSRLLGRGTTALLLAATWGRQGAYVVADHFHRTDALVRSRSSELGPRDRQLHDAIIRTVVVTPLPGIDG